jgi:ElaB/YqjD/DUF883 family membrane-anchored ribosome-binding protein
MYANQWKDASRRRVVSDVSDLVRDVEDYLAASAGQTGETMAAGRDRVLASLAATKSRLAEFEHDAAARSRAAGRAADAYVHENAWQAIAAAACVGVVAGWLTARR